MKAIYRCEMNYDLVKEDGHFRWKAHKTSGDVSLEIPGEGPFFSFRCPHCNGNHTVHKSKFVEFTE